MSNELNYIENFSMETQYGSLEDIAKEVGAMKFALGLFFRSLPDEHKIAHINTLESLPDEEFKELAIFLRQFMNIKKMNAAGNS